MFISNTSYPFHCIQVVVALLLVGTVAAALVVALLLVDAAAPTVATCAAALAGKYCIVRHALCHIVRIST